MFVCVLVGKGKKGDVQISANPFKLLKQSSFFTLEHSLPCVDGDLVKDIDTTGSLYAAVVSPILASTSFVQKSSDRSMNFRYSRCGSPVLREGVQIVLMESSSSWAYVVCWRQRKRIENDNRLWRMVNIAKYTVCLIEK